MALNRIPRHMLFLPLMASTLILSLLGGAPVYGRDGPEPTSTPEYPPGTPQVVSTEIIDLTSETTLMSLTPTQTYLVRISVSDSESIGQLQNVIIKFWFDTTGASYEGSFFDNVEKDGLDYFKITWLRDSNKYIYWTNGGSDWAVTEAKLPTKDELKDPDLTTYNFEFTIVVGKTAMQTLDIERWQFGSVAVDQRGLSTYTPYDVEGVFGLGMDWYGEVQVPQQSLEWGFVPKGIEFTDPRAKNCLSGDVIFISNRIYFPAVKSDTEWHNPGSDFVTLSELPVEANTFALRAFQGKTDQPDMYGVALNTLGDPVNFAEGGTRTSETGIAYSDICFYLSLSNEISGSGRYNGTISIVIHN